MKWGADFGRGHWFYVEHNVRSLGRSLGRGDGASGLMLVELDAVIRKGAVSVSGGDVGVPWGDGRDGRGQGSGWWWRSQLLLQLQDHAF